jgi:ribonucleoside-diphosphate reductase alpha chain
MKENPNLFNKQYFYKNEFSMEDVFERIAFYKKKKNDSAFCNRIFKYLCDGWFVPATPILSNFGTDRALPISCFLNEAEDNMQSIIDKGVSEISNLMALGGGVATNWSNIREIGSKISSGGQTSGVIPFIKNQEVLAMSISQGGSLRRGNIASYLHVSHPEIEEFVEMRRPTGGDISRKILHGHHAVILDDIFMQRVITKGKYELKSPKTKEVIQEIDAFELWTKILLARMETGEPYIMFEDNANNQRCESYVKNKLYVSTSNLCVAPETQILTKEFGWAQIQKVANKEVEIWNGFEWSTVTPRKTGENQKLIKVRLSDGNEIDATEYHKWFIQEKYGIYNTCFLQKETKDLQVGDKIIKYEFPIMFDGKKELEFAYANGFFSGDGCELKNGKQRIYLYHEKRNLKSKIGFENLNWKTQNNNKREYIDLANGTLQNKFFVPNHEYSIQSKLRWLAGLCDADGTIAKNDTNQSLQIASINLEFLQKIQYMLYTLGCGCKITKMCNEGFRKMPTNNAKKTKYQDYFCQKAYRLLIDSNQLYLLNQLGFQTHRLQYKKMLPQRSARQFIQIAEIIHHNRIDDTYCLTEPKRGMVVFNGVLTGNCNEIYLTTTPKDYNRKSRTAVCCLSSLNLEHFDSFKKDSQFFLDVLTFLDNVLTEFIVQARKLKKHSYIADAVYSAVMERSIGLGVMGLHSHLQQKGMPFDSDEAMIWNEHIFKIIGEQTNKANIKLGKTLGVNPDCKRAGLTYRFSNVTAIAPTASISLVANTSPSIEPYVSNIYVQKNKEGTSIIKNKNLLKVFSEYAEYRNDPEAIWSSIVEHQGSVQHLSFLSEEHKKIFKTAFEIDMNYVVSMASTRQKYIDQGQSINLFFLPDVQKKYFNEVHLKAWKEGLKGLYYVRSMSIGKMLSRKTTIEEKPEFQVDFKKIVEEQIEFSKMHCNKDDLSCLSCQ